jgi:glycosyltransferase involved in cell wall biosynthesis
MSKKLKTAIIHYSAPPTIGGVEAVIAAHAKVFLEEGYPLKIIAGRGKRSALPEGTGFIELPLLDSQNKAVLKVNNDLEKGLVSSSYDQLQKEIKDQLKDALEDVDNVIVHNLLSKNFNLAATEAIISLLDEGKIPNLIAWCHDFSLSSARDKKSLHDGSPWDFLRTYYPKILYVVVSQQRQETLSELLDIPKEKINVIYNGFNPDALLGITDETSRLVNHLNLEDADLIALMPVRITRAKNIELAMQIAANLKSELGNPLIILTGPPDPHDPDNMAYFKELKNLRKKLGVENNFKFLFEENPESDEPYILNMKIVADLYRESDIVLMTSHREGFGMPVIEAGFSGKPVFSSNIPAAKEIGGNEIFRFSLNSSPEQITSLITDWASSDSVHLMRVRTRQNFTWQKIFSKKIQPLLTRK